MDMAKAQMAAQPDNIMMLMMLVLPVATQALLPILAEFGFPQDQGGLMMFMSAVGKHKDDAEITALGKQMRATFVPENPRGGRHRHALGRRRHVGRTRDERRRDAKNGANANANVFCFRKQIEPFR